MALKLSKLLGRTPESWLAMQDNFDLYPACEKLDLNNYEPMLFVLQKHELTNITKLALSPSLLAALR